MSWLNASTCSRSPSRAASASSDGISTTHGPHQVAHRLTSTGRPRNIGEARRAPGRVLEGDGRRRRAGVRAVEPAGRIGLGRRRGIGRRRGASPCGAAAFCLSHPASARPISEAGEKGDHEPQGSGLQCHVGRPLRRGALGAHARDKCLDRLRQAALARRTSPRPRAHIAMLAAQGIVSQDDADAIEEGLDRIEDEYARAAWPRIRRSRTSTCMSSTASPS